MYKKIRQCLFWCFGAYLLIYQGFGYANELTLAVANSTCHVIKQVGLLYTEKTGTKINYICKSSGRLAKGIKGMAINADIYLSANQVWMDYVVKENLIRPEKIVSPWGNSLVVAAPISNPLELNNWRDLVRKKIKTVLIGDPGTAPFGRYAKQAMKKSNIWDSVKKKIVTQKHISLLAKKLALSGSHTVGILFSTNVNSKLKILLSIDPSWHKPIQYFLAPLKNSVAHNQADRFIDFLQNKQARMVFRSAGFILREI